MPGRILPRMLVGAVLVTAVLASGSAVATSEPTVDFEEFVKESDGNRAVLTQMLVYDHDRLASERGLSASHDLVANIEIAMEDGATIRELASEHTLGRYEHYLPLDIEVTFERSGVFIGKARVRLQLGDAEVIENRYFWVRHDETGSSFISHKDYSEERRRAEQARQVPTDPHANLEPGDVPGQAGYGEIECAPGLPRRGGLKCPQ